MNQHPDFSNRSQWAKFSILLVAMMVLPVSCSLGATTAASTPKPTDTVLPMVSPPPTATKKATPNKAATQRIRQQNTSAAATDFAGAALGEVQSKLDEVGEKMGSGSVVFLYQDPIPVESSKANVIVPQFINQDIHAADFAFHSAITWETKQKVGIVYCAMIFRLQGEWTTAPWYMMRMGRVSGYGHIYFDVMQGLSIRGESNQSVSQAIRDGNGDTNDVLLVARANQFTVYVNGRQAAVWWNAKIDQGGFGFGTLQDTGSSVCTFADSWIYAFT
jgi:hypothetical protein